MLCCVCGWQWQSLPYWRYIEAGTSDFSRIEVWCQTSGSGLQVALSDTSAYNWLVARYMNTTATFSSGGPNDALSRRLTSRTEAGIILLNARPQAALVR